MARKTRKHAATKKTPKRAANRATKAVRPAAKPTLLTGGNPQIAIADGDAPVQAYIAAMPGWKREVGSRLDALIVRHAPGVRKAVKWNSPFYGIDRGWFVSFHVFTHYVKVTFFNGTSLRPVPPGGTSKDARWIDIHENDFDEPQMAAWVKQAASIPGWGKSEGGNMKGASELIDRRIAELADWRGETLSRMRQLIKQADPDVLEELKWVKKTNPGTPTWSHDGIICTGETYKSVVKLTFAKGAFLKDPARLFNASLEGNTRRAIDIREDDAIDERAFKELIRAAVAFNAAKRKR